MKSNAPLYSYLEKCPKLNIIQSVLPTPLHPMYNVVGRTHLDMPISLMFKLFLIFIFLIIKIIQNLRNILMRKIEIIILYSNFQRKFITHFDDDNNNSNLLNFFEIFSLRNIEIKILYCIN
jgi:hypothetical protein